MTGMDARANRMVFIAALALATCAVHASEPATQSAAVRSAMDPTVVSANEAKRWGLDTTEYQRYLSIIEGPLGRWNRTIDPVMALGMFAETDVERRRYAERYAQQEFELLTRTQAFERAYRDAFQRLYPHAQIIASEHMAEYYAHQSQKRQGSRVPDFLRALQTGDRLLYFPEFTCDDCQNAVAQLQAVLARNAHLQVDVYIRGIDDAPSARAWASQNRVDVGLVRQGRITVNVDDGTYTKLNARSQHATSYYLSRGEHVFAVKPSDVAQL